jgi:hypothetical protein
MQSWIEGFQESIDYMEEHMADELDIEASPGRRRCRRSTTSGSSAPCAG